MSVIPELPVCGQNPDSSFAAQKIMGWIPESVRDEAAAPE